MMSGSFSSRNFLGDVRHVDVDVVLVRAGAAAFENLEDHRTRHDVTRSEVLDGGCVTLHEAFTVGITENATFTADGFRDQDAETGESCRVELVELHVLEGQALAEDDAHGRHR